MQKQDDTLRLASSRATSFRPNLRAGNKKELLVNTQYHITERKQSGQGGTTCVNTVTSKIRSIQKASPSQPANRHFKRN